MQPPFNPTVQFAGSVPTLQRVTQLLRYAKSSHKTDLALVSRRIWRNSSRIATLPENVLKTGLIH